MRIRRRPRALIPTPLQLEPASDPPTAPQPPTNAQSASQLKKEEEVVEEKNSYRPNVNLWDASSWPAALPAQPQEHGGNVMGMGRSSENTPGPAVDGPGGGGGAQRQAAADAHGSLENANCEDCDMPVTNAAGERLINAVIVPAMPLMLLNVSGGNKGDGSKKRSRPAVQLEGSRCSRANGRNWRCNQTTMFGYSLCAHHVSMGRNQARMGRQSQNADANSGASTTDVPKLGCTEPSSRKSVSPRALAMVATEPSDAIEPAPNLANGGVQ